MADTPLALSRIVAHGLTRPGGTVREVVQAQLAMQGQDLPGVIASIALRTGGAVRDVLDAFDRGEIVRAYPMRGTVFAMAAEDALWVGELCNAAQVRAQIKRRSALGLSDGSFDIGRLILERVAFEGVPRAELFAEWQNAGIETSGGRGYHMLSHFVQIGVASYGSWNGSDNNVHLAEEWLPEGSGLEGRFNGDRVAAATELLGRYFASHGPASIRDAAWWTKLPLKLLREAAEGLGDSIERVETDDETLYQRAGLADEIAEEGKSAREPRLIPGFDELMLGYPDRSYMAGEEHLDKLAPGNNGVFKHTAIAGGAVQGTWKRGGRPGKRTFDFTPWREVSATRMREFKKAFEAFPFPMA
ncbi:winged helix DNA-binding domain-containing protein [Agrococcus casei]|uniref:winged helix DNA-binding domain-containing protein n=1 Tax=Agrococcus casei TaxID=343512 RepID=UPI003F93270F